jgi:hypothetical protein
MAPPELLSFFERMISHPCAVIQSKKLNLPARFSYSPPWMVITSPLM